MVNNYKINDPIKVLWITNIPSPYRVKFFEKLGEKIELTVIFEKEKSDERHESWKQTQFEHFRAVFLNGYKIRTDSAFSVKVFSYLRESKEYDYVLVSNPLTPLGIVTISYLKKHKIAFFIETDGGFAKSGKGIQEVVKKKVISAASGWMSTAKLHDEYYIKYGAKKEYIFRYPFSSVLNKDILLEPIQPERKEQIRKALGIKQKQVVLSVGQFIHRKGFDLLLRAAVSIPKNVAIVIVGGEITEEYAGLINTFDLHNVYFPGYKVGKELLNYFQAADVFVLPTREDIWGLVINEAMAEGLPIVTTDKCISGTEMIEDGFNGFIIPSDNSVELSRTVNYILQNKRHAQQMANNSLYVASQYTIETMVEWHERFFQNNSE